MISVSSYTQGRELDLLSVNCELRSEKKKKRKKRLGSVCAGKMTRPKGLQEWNVPPQSPEGKVGSWWPLPPQCNQQWPRRSTLGNNPISEISLLVLVFPGKKKKKLFFAL